MCLIVRNNKWVNMDLLNRLLLLGSQMHLEPSEDQFERSNIDQRKGDIFIHQAAMPNGKHIRLLKTLLTSVCERDCYYCPFRAGRDFRRVTFKPHEFAHLFLELYKHGVAEGLFISSGIAGSGMKTQDRLLDTIDILRHKLNYRGYVHLKIMPGAERGQVERAMHLADRVSINLEAPNPESLTRLAPQKLFTEELLDPLSWVDEIRHNEMAKNAWHGRWPSTVTQFVTGVADESDLELLTTTNFLYRNLGLKRIYYSSFNPIPDTPLENRTPTNPKRELRLYQASFLLRDYGYKLEDIPLEPDGNLSLLTDPKLAWAHMNLIENPLDINHASKEQLIRIPGIGPKSADAIIKARRECMFHDISRLRPLGLLPERLFPFILLDGKKPSVQMTLI